VGSKIGPIFRLRLRRAEDGAVSPRHAPFTGISSEPPAAPAAGP